jgi:tetratricopeptide (TPR) repeat protein
MRIVAFAVVLLAFVGAKIPAERGVDRAQRGLHLRSVDFNLSLREQIGQLGFVAALSGFRAIVADVAFIQAHVAWERTDWARVLWLFREATTLQPHVILFWDMATWHMAWNASVAALNDPLQSRQALRVKAQRDYIAVGKDFLERGISNNPDRPELYEALGRLYRDKLNDHPHAAECFAKAAALAGAKAYDKRFAAYELSYSEGHEREAYEQLRVLYDSNENERLPTLLKRLKVLEEKLHVPIDQRIPRDAP